MLDEVGLADRGRSSYRTYSLGMKQRLAIAATLLKDPELLIFDEPTNGLDPAGIHEIRATMRGLADRGKTVLVSSHILNEVQQVADTVTIIGRGRLLAEGTVDEILAGGGQSIRVGVADPPARAGSCSRRGFTVSRLPGRLWSPPDRGVGSIPPGSPGYSPSRALRLRADPRPQRPGVGVPGADRRGAPRCRGPAAAGPRGRRCPGSRAGRSESDDPARGLSSTGSVSRRFTADRTAGGSSGRSRPSSSW